jgi:1-aminocyclopropane-1-carboxylate deaminase/D-cysteine desulfhydrase-like pyridoxal-dependent ACC family enzyme
MRLKLQRPGPLTAISMRDAICGRIPAISIGGVQSNHTRQVAAVAARAGLDSNVLYAHLGGLAALNAYSGVFR